MTVGAGRDDESEDGMAWTDPRTWREGELVTAASMNRAARDDLADAASYALRTHDTAWLDSVTQAADRHVERRSGAGERWSWGRGVNRLVDRGVLVPERPALPDPAPLPKRALDLRED